jgi:hypothetical protein
MHTTRPCLNLDTGEEIWKSTQVHPILGIYKYPAIASTPLISRDLIVLGEINSHGGNKGQARNLAAVYDGKEVIPTERLEQAKEALRELVNFRKEHENVFFSDLLHVTSFWERPRMNIDTLVSTIIQPATLAMADYSHLLQSDRRG